MRNTRNKAQRRAIKEAFNKFLSVLLTFAMVLQTSPVAYARMDEGGVGGYVAPTEEVQDAADVQEQPVVEEEAVQAQPEEQVVGLGHEQGR